MTFQGKYAKDFAFDDSVLDFGTFEGCPGSNSPKKHRVDFASLTEDEITALSVKELRLVCVFGNQFCFCSPVSFLSLGT
jgi:hypothetical protein